jgi:hypothetical protein
MGAITWSLGSTARSQAGMGLDSATVRSVSANGSDAAVAVYLVPGAFRRSLGIRMDVASRVLVGAANPRMATHGLAGFESLG